LTVEASGLGAARFYGPEFSDNAAGVRKSDAPIPEAPRSTFTPSDGFVPGVTTRA